MLRVNGLVSPSILVPDDGPVAAVENPGGQGGICLVCEHASAAIPSSLGGLGLADTDRYAHAVWDIGAEALARKLAGTLDAPLVVSRVSRLVYDCNRPPEAPDAIPARTERIEVPGNRGLSDADRRARVAEIYVPFQALLAETLDGFSRPPALVTIHSFTPVWHGAPRSTEIGLLHDDDARLARAMQALAGGGFRVALNEPYSAKDGVTHTLRKHGLQRGIPNVMIEVRNDLLADDAAVGRAAAFLAHMLVGALAHGADAA